MPRFSRKWSLRSLPGISKIHFLCSSQPGNLWLVIFLFLLKQINKMKKPCLYIILCITLFLSGCLDTTQEITLNEDGSGILKNTNDMSTMVGLLKQMGQNDAMSKLEDRTVDSTFALAPLIDSSTTLTAEEKALARQGSMYLNIDMKAEKLINTMILPFAKPGDIAKLNKISDKLMDEAMDKQLGKMPEMGTEEMPEQSSLDDYFNITYSKGLITRSLDKEKYANAANDEYLKAIKEASAMGIPMVTTYIFNLPVPAKKVEGKNVKVSKDNKQVTVKANIEDFFDDPGKFEFKIEY
jgi:hypothetical protein